MISIPLESKPVIIACGLATHGYMPVQSFKSNYWALHLYAYSADYKLEGESLPIHPGYMGFTPPNMVSEYKWHEKTSSHLFFHFQFNDSSSVQKTQLMPAMIDYSSSYEVLKQRLTGLIEVYVRYKLKAEVMLWDTLLHISDIYTIKPDQPKNRNPVIDKAMALIEHQLGATLTAAQIAGTLGYSHNHINLLFKAATGTTLKAYILTRRVERAKHLLQSTDMRIKAIAWECGIPDAQLFNKTIRKHLGASPTQYRKRASGYK